MDDAGLQLRLLGPLEADYRGVPADLGGPRQRAVLALLLVARGEVVSVDRMIDDLWRGEPPPRATGALQAYVSNLRRALEPDRPPRTPAHVLVSVPPGYAVRLPTDAVDAWAFERHLRAATETEDPHAARAALATALQLWRGSALAEFAAEPWAAPEAARLEELRLVARERLIDATLRAGAPAEAAIAAEALAREVPLREEVWRLLALAQYAGGRQADALATLRRARGLLADELGIDPGPQLVRLERDVLAQTVALAEPPPRPGPAAADGVLVAPSAPARSTGGAFVGRRAELATLRAAAEAAVPGRPEIVLLAGEPGAGKSALLAPLRTELAGQGWRVAVGRCPEIAGGPPAWAWAEALRGLADLAPPGPFATPLASLLSDQPAHGDAGDALVGRFRLHHAVGDWFSTLADRPLAILLDDVHRADVETRNLLASLLDQAPAGRLLVVLAYRPEAGEQVDDLLARLAPHAPTRVRLAGLAPAEAAELVAAVTGADVAPEVVAALVDRTEGNPFYLTESARLLASEGEVVATAQVPAGVADVLRRRFARLPEESVSVLRLASVLGRDVDVPLLIRAAETGEDAVLDALEAGLLSGLLVENGADRVRFSHVLVRETLYGGIPGVRRIRWHARVAAAVAELYPADVVALAYHSTRAATPLTAEAAVGYALAAADLAEGRFSYDTAAELYQQALTCLDLQPEPPAERRVRILSRLLPALIRAGNTARALVVRTEAIRLADATGDEDLLVDTITAWNVPTPWTNRAYQTVDAVLVEIVERVLRSPARTPRQRCLLLCTLVRETSYDDNPRTAEAAAEALELARSIGEPELLALALMANTEVHLPDLHPEEWDALRHELREVAERNDLIVFGLLADFLDLRAASARLDLATWQERFDRFRTTAQKYELRPAVIVTYWLEGHFAHLTGDLPRAEAAYQQAYDEQRRVNGVDAKGQFGLAMTTVRLTQDRIGEMTDVLAGITAELPPAADAYALALLADGRPAEARQALRNPPHLYVDVAWLLWTALRGLAVAAVGDRDRAADLYETLLPYSDRVAGAGSSGFVLTPVARVLGQLAALLDRPDDAIAHFEQAAEVARRVGSEPWLAQIERDAAGLTTARA